MCGGQRQDGGAVLGEERLAAGEAELLHTERDGFPDEGRHIVRFHQVEAAVTRPRPLEAERTGQIAGGTEVKPDFAQANGIDVTTWFAAGGESISTASLDHLPVTFLFPVQNAYLDNTRPIYPLVRQAL